MSFERPLPPPLPPNGDLLREWGYLDEARAAFSLDLSPQTLIDYRKSGIGPEFAVCGRAILYSRDSLQKWLEAGGTRPSIESGAVPDPTAKKPRQAKPRARTPADIDA
jgi:hypothetical protein